MFWFERQGQSGQLEEGIIRTVFPPFASHSKKSMHRTQFLRSNEEDTPGWFFLLAYAVGKFLITLEAWQELMIISERLKTRRNQR